MFNLRTVNADKLSCLWLFTIYLTIVAPFSFYHLFKGSVQIFYILIVLLSLPYLRKTKVNIICTISFFLSALYINIQSLFISGGIYGYQYFLNLPVVICFLLLPQKNREQIQNIFIKGLAIFIAISLFEYVTYLLTGEKLIQKEVVRIESDGVQSFYHLLLNLIKYDNLIPRYQFICDEPGRLGTLCAFLVFLTHNTKYRKEQIVFLLAGLFSLSFAFYVLLALSILYILKSKLVTILFFLIIFGISYYSFQEHIDKLIFTRLENFEGRETYSMKVAINRMFANNEEWFGYGVSVSIPDGAGEGNTVGVIRELYRIGVIGLAIVLLQYIYMLTKFNGKKFRTLMFIIIFLASYYQRSHIYDLAYLTIFFPFPSEK